MPLFTPETPQSILSKLRSVDGANSGLDADTLDGYHAADLQGGGGGTPGGNDTEIQYNNNGAFGGNANLTYVDGVVNVNNGSIVVNGDDDLTVATFTVPSSDYYILFLQNRSQEIGLNFWIEDGSYGGDQGSLYVDALLPLTVTEGLASFSPLGKLGINTGYGPVNAGLDINCGASALPGLLIKLTANTTDAVVFKNASDQVLFSVGNTGRIKTNQAVTNTNTPSGATSKAMPIYDASGNLLGYIPVYASQW